MADGFKFNWRSMYGLNFHEINEIIRKAVEASCNETMDTMMDNLQWQGEPKNKFDPKRYEGWDIVDAEFEEIK